MALDFDYYDDFFDDACLGCGIGEPIYDGLCGVCLDEEEDEREFEDFLSYEYGTGTRLS